jgi:hypothetical protein
MQLILIVTALVALAAHAPEAAGFKHDSIQARHHNIGRGLAAVVKPKAARTNAKRCTKKKSSTVGSSTSTKTSTSKGKQQPTSKASTVHQKGTISVSSSCGNIGATTETTKSSGPNGAEGWLNCGLTGGGWNPPNVQVSDIIAISLEEAFSMGNYDPRCSQYTSIFKKYGAQYGIPPIFLAAFAMQESTCNAYISPGGLMQITSDKWYGAPGGNQQDPDFNIGRGAQYFASVLNGDANGNPLVAVGEYNGWYRGMTSGKVLSESSCQQNLDYLQQFFNAWIQGQNGYNYGTWNNQNGCAS